MRTRVGLLFVVVFVLFVTSGLAQTVIPPGATTANGSTEHNGLWSFDTLSDTTYVPQAWTPSSAKWGELAWTTHARPPQSIGQSFYFRHAENVRLWIGPWDEANYGAVDTSKLSLVILRKIDHGKRPFDGKRVPFDKVFKFDHPYTHAGGPIVIHMEAGTWKSNLPCPQCWWDFETFYDKTQKGPQLVDKIDLRYLPCANIKSTFEVWNARGLSRFRVEAPGVTNAPCILAFGQWLGSQSCARVWGVVFIPHVLTGNVAYFDIPLPQADFDTGWQAWVFGTTQQPNDSFGPGHQIRSIGWATWNWKGYWRASRPGKSVESIEPKISMLR